MLNQTSPHPGMQLRRQFASDNNAGICPAAMAALEEANCGHVPGYGEDPITEQAREMFNQIFEKKCQTFFVSNGTAANCLALAALLQAFHAVIAHQFSHLESDECNGLGRFVPGAKILLASGVHAKIDPENLTALLAGQRTIHSSKPAVLSVTNATELGTTYQPSELATLARFTQEYGLFLHVDGARLANAVAAHSCSLAELTWKVGADVVSFGGTKNGIGFGEAIVFFRDDLAEGFEYRMKQAGQLASKMRFLSAPWIGLLKSGVWRENALHANAMARLLEESLEAIGVPAIYPREANAVFVHLPRHVVNDLYRQGWRFYTDVGPDGGARLMCSWDTTVDDVKQFSADVSKAVRGKDPDK
jgi:threonine aldolase